MRTWILAGLAIATVALTDAHPASARTCMREHGCGYSASATSTTSRAHHASKRRSHQTAAASRHARRVDSGGSGAHSGMASYYHKPQRLASGGRFNPNALTAAHKTLPFGTKVRVTNVATGRTVTVRVNDRGPFVKGRVIDVSHAAAESLGMVGNGVAKVKLDVVQ